jgi:hypothetical protein
MIRLYGMTDQTWTKYVLACTSANMPTRAVLQTIGNAPASAGTHAQDGVLNGVPYCAAFDIRTRDLSTDQVEWLWLHLIKAGLVCWWRHTGSFADNQHMHCIDPALRMKRALRDQVHAFLARKSGLVGEAAEPFLLSPDHLSDADAQAIRAAFLAHNPAEG